MFVNTPIRDHDEIMLEPEAKIKHSERVNVLLKKKSNLQGHDYDVCPSGCRLYGIADGQSECSNCGEARYKMETELVKAPVAQMKLLSIGDIISKMLADPDTQELLHYRANRKSRAGEISDILTVKTISN
ncbi:hypothetical protein CLU79DRAFT_722820 [Phycomyces nitens]|nr:hypothetical protein CLU79DRAFT_722820 [Phycomyces nitens]